MGKHRSMRITAVTILTLAVASLWPAHAQTVLEDKVKAAFVYNFAKFIDWPPEATSSETFNICIAGRASVGDMIERTLENKAIKNRLIQVRQIGWSIRELDACHILYVNDSNSSQVESMLAAAHSRPILTIGETGNFTDEGGIIRFLLVEGKIRFSINQVMAQRVGLNISAKLLEVAFQVLRHESGVNGTLPDKQDVSVS